MAMSPGERPPTDGFGFPIQQDRKAPGYAVLAGAVICSVGSGGLALSQYIHGGIPHAVLWAGAGMGFLPLAALRAVDKFAKRLGAASKRVLVDAIFVAATSGALLIFMILSLSPCSSRCVGA